ncbi:hypothetical protein OU798_01825 [Prolixibacteraceae bacterium Z1-6]|uniref:GLPGLI family protein n=1 Tax=Draconibacterium aestuarii TaxID=2998507 RepID=A0A9X3F3E6_9BACT|nr:hypothetical protein [Prolixibacteraceae bacterium Z1-6]
MKKLHFILIGLLFCSLFSAAQTNYQLGESIEFYRSTKMRSGEWNQTLTSKDIEGSPYLNDEFINGTVFTTSKLQYQNIPLRYNIFNDDMEFRTPDNQVMAIAAPEIIESVEFGEFKMKYLPYSAAKKIRRGFFKELVNGKVSLYAKPNILYTEPQKPAPYKEAQPAKFTNKPDFYYIREGTESAQKIDNKNVLIQFFPDHQKEVAAFVKKNKIKHNKEEDLTELINYYNSL